MEQKCRFQNLKVTDQIVLFMVYAAITMLNTAVLFV